VFGFSDHAFGVFGETTSTDKAAVAGQTYSAGGSGVSGYNAARYTFGYLGAEYGAYGERGDFKGWLGYSDVGVYGKDTGSQNDGFLGRADKGVLGRAFSSGGVGVQGESSNGEGVYGVGGNAAGVHGFSSSKAGVWGDSTNDVGIYGTSTTSFAGYFDGPGFFSGWVVKPAGAFMIDHPLHPSDKYLYHSFVESPDMKNVYDGVVTTDADGLAVVQLPDWFESLNRDFRYQLTVIGRFAQAIIEQKIENNRFTIRTNLGNVEVSWQVTGIRQDAWANAHRIPVEADKPEKERGTYLHPEELGQPEEMSVERARHPEMMQRMKESREVAVERAQEAAPQAR